MYMRALRIEPRAHALLTFDKVEELLPTSANSSRVGRGPDSTSFAAFPSLAADTLAEIPYPLERFATLPASATLTHSAALDRNSSLLLAFASDWAEQFPQSADAYEALADILDVRGEASDTRAGRISAVGAALRALELIRAHSSGFGFLRERRDCGSRGRSFEELEHWRIPSSEITRLSRVTRRSS